MPNEPRAWMLLSFEDGERQYAGNLGYSDDTRRIYRYDSFVPNHLQMSEGDIALVRSKTRLLGVARISSISAVEGIKEQRRCPECGSNALKERTTRPLKFRCDGKHEFSEPVVEKVPCTLYAADFGSTFARADGVIEAQWLKDACPRYSDQLAIQEIQIEPLAPRLLVAVPGVASLVRANAEWLASDEACLPKDAPFVAPTVDAREAAIRLVRLRRGQADFRETLRRRYGDGCLISGCELMDIVEAAHIAPYRGPACHHPENGLLLRTDLHTLFDLDLLGVEPGTLTIHLHEAVRSAGYGHLAGTKLKCSVANSPSDAALRMRWLWFENRSAPGQVRRNDSHRPQG